MRADKPSPEKRTALRIKSSYIAGPHLSYRDRPSDLNFPYRQKIGLYGGSFNPVHSGHHHVAKIAIKRLNLQKLIWFVSPQNPLKSSKGLMSLHERMEAITRKIARQPQKFAKEKISDLETRLGTHHSIFVLLYLKRRFPKTKFVWIMGSDSFTTFHRWRCWDQIMRLLPILVIARPETVIKSGLSPTAKRFSRFRHSPGAIRKLPYLQAPAWILLHAPMNKESSSAIRKA